MEQESPVTFVRLWGNGIGDSGADLLAQSLLGRKIKCIDLGYNKIGDSEAHHRNSCLNCKFVYGTY